MNKDIYYMQKAIELAKKGIGKVNPNPLVGAVIVKDGKIISSGYHKSFGGLHAEREAILNTSTSLANSTLYVTLEPCCHYGKTPPCTDIIIDSGIKRVVVGSLDPNPLISGNGIRILKKSGIEVEVGVLQEDCKNINEIFYHYITHNTPFVTMKYAMTLDGKISSYTGDSKWITGEKARQFVHKERNRNMAIMVGVQTIIVDNPRLTCRIENGRNPIRIVCDTHLRTPLDSSVVKTSKDIPTIIATSENTMDKKIINYEKFGVKVIKIQEKDEKIDLQQLMIHLGKMGIDSILLEGGSFLNFSALQENIVNKIQAYISPKIIGGKEATTPVAGLGIADISKAFKLNNLFVSKFGDDFLLEGKVSSLNTL